MDGVCQMTSKYNCGQMHCDGSCRVRNPDPKYFTIKDVQYLNGFTIVSVHYDNCAQFEGVKILVFKGDFRLPLYGIKEINPHFVKTHKLNLVARFIPTDEGVEMAKTFCSAFGKPVVTYRDGDMGNKQLCNDGAGGGVEGRTFRAFHPKDL